MREICIPIPELGGDQIANVEVTIAGVKQSFNFRVESFPWIPSDEDQPLEGAELLDAIAQLRDSIESYEKGWEIVQLFTPPAGAEFIQVLFRQKVRS